MSTFEPSSIIAILKSFQLANGQRAFEVNWKSRVSDKAPISSWKRTCLMLSQVKKRLDGWIKARGIGQVERVEQLEWAAHVVEYVQYMHNSITVGNGAKKVTAPTVLSNEVPLLGPRFVPPTYLHLRRRDPTPNVNPRTAYLKPINIIHPFFYPEVARCPQCESRKIGWEGWTTSGPRNVHGVKREETVIGVQLECKGECAVRFKGTNAPEKGTYCFATTNATFWQRWEHWEIPR